jgi:hypothetical protein
MLLFQSAQVYPTQGQLQRIADKGRTVRAQLVHGLIHILKQTFVNGHLDRFHSNT